LVRAVPDEKLPEPITVRFEHRESPERRLTNPICLRWDSEIHEWSGKVSHFIQPFEALFYKSSRNDFLNLEKF
jgi:hypothetical protein